MEGGFTLSNAPDDPGPVKGLTAAELAEFEAIQRAVELTYEVSSFEDASSADPEDFRTAFTETATLGYTRGEELVTLSVDEYVELRRGLIQGGALQSLVEWELHGETEFFGHVAHRISSYAVRVDGTDDLAERGVMSFQLMKVAGEWKVHSLIWHAESEATPLTARYGGNGVS